MSYQTRLLHIHEAYTYLSSTSVSKAVSSHTRVLQFVSDISWCDGDALFSGSGEQTVGMVTGLADCGIWSLNRPPDKCWERVDKVRPSISDTSRNNDVDGEAISYGLTETMVAYLFEGSFKKQAKFLQFAHQLKEAEPTTTLTFEILPNDCLSPTWQVQEYGNFPAVFTLPTFPKDIQTKLDAKQPCHKVSTDRHKINTWHMSLKRRFKAERTPLVHHEVVRNMKQKFGYHRSPQAPENNQGSITTSVRRSSDIISVSGEDESSVDAHTQVL
ncbi:hypothetical protein F7725_026492 [Dissostichus mawsoni]|uniref:Uncharacterized protein n=1 Tax=Dissostichus mawsoni TaxID=36200 RepID=A0A7J5X865_DISMA|nr:hypothetical protein F7725_026492 [Dissostichus mawsoni]